MALKLNTAPTIEPLSLAEVKAHLRLDSEDISDDIIPEQSIAPGDHVVAASYSLVGSAIEVRGYTVLVLLESGTNGEGGTVDVKLQDSEDNVTWTDVSSGAFTQVTTANDNATQEKTYTGAKRYLRAVATVGTATCDFGVTILKDASTTVEDDLLTSLITAAREYCEAFQNRGYLTQTWELWLDEWPDKNYIELPRPPLASVTTLKYYETDDTENTAYEPDAETPVGTDTYYTDLKSEPGRLCLKYGESWPSDTLRPYNGICVTFVAGEAAASSVKKKWKQAMLLIIGDMYENREGAGSIEIKENPAVMSLLWQDRIF